MQVLLGYHILEKLKDTPSTRVYRGKKTDHDEFVVIKVLKVQNPSASEMARFKQEHYLIQKLNIPEILKTSELKKADAGLALVLEDFKHATLKTIIESRKIELSEFLRIAISLTNTFGMLHYGNIIHKDITSNHILIHPESGQVKITDFGIVSELTQQYKKIYTPYVIEHKIVYMSPEQTGRMNRTVDYRTDIYSLGVVFYEMLTGRLPFESSDPMELIHAHMARKPEPPSAILDSIPQVISDIIMKMLTKTAEERYQNSFGIMADLKKSKNLLENSGSITSFELARKDISNKFNIPQKIFGREEQVDALLSAFKRVANGKTEILLVSGSAGIGKSALINEIHKPVVAKRGYFISGKYERFRQNVPYSSIIQAFQQLIRQILAQSRENIDTWRKNFLASLGPYGKVVVDIIPDLELIVGPQPNVPELEPEDSRNRLRIVFEKFTTVLAQPGHPLVLFLDDLQWADSASLELIEILLIQSGIRNLLMIVAFRDNEISVSHPFFNILQTMKKNKNQASELSLTPLEIIHVSDFITEVFRSNPETVRPLAELIHQKTNGNPFFVNQFLKILYEDKLIQHQAASGWQWDLEAIRQVQVTDNVVDLMVSKIEGLPSSIQEVLKVCACIGNRFNLETLSTILESPMGTTLADLSQAISEGLVGVWETNYVFHHDRIQEAAYSLVPELEKKKLHHRIGRLFLDGTSEEKLVDNIFYIVNQLNLGEQLLSSPEERNELVRLNLIAGKKAKSTGAYSSALEYFETGLKLLPAAEWDEQYELMLDMHGETATAAYLLNDFYRMDKLAQIVFQRTHNILDKVKVYSIQMKSYWSQNKVNEAISTALDVLNQLGVQIPRKPNDRHILEGLERTKSNLSGKKIEDLANLPEAKSPSVIAAMSLLSTASSAAFPVGYRYYPLLACKMVDLSLEHGNMPVSISGYLAYGILCCMHLEDFETGYAFGKLTRNLQKKYCSKGHPDKSGLSYNAFIRHWKEPYKNTLPELKDAVQIGKETGDFNYAAISMHFYNIYSWRAGINLSELHQEFKESDEIMIQLKRKSPARWNAICHQTILNFMGKSNDPLLLQGGLFDEVETLPLLISQNDHSSLFDLYFGKVFLNLFFQNYGQALENADQCNKYLQGVPGLFFISLFCFFDSLTRLGAFPEASEEDQERFIKKVSSNIKRLETWTEHAPMNHLHQLHLIRAEQARVSGQYHEAVDYYDLAVDFAKESGLIFDEALANELAGRFYLSRNKIKFAKVYLEEARNLYHLWGATAKVVDMENKYPELIQVINHEARIEQGEESESAISKEFTSLDFNTVIKASMAISGEIMLDRLLAKLMLISIENAGAQKGFLILEDQGRLLVEAEGEVGRKEVIVLKAIPVETHANLCPAIVNYVKRTRKPLILHDATHTGEFSGDPYIQENMPKSILCFPIISQGRLSGIIYLENDLTTGAFTSERLEVLKNILSQAAISLENARLYETVKKGEERMKNLLETANEGFWEIDKKGYTLSVNPELCRIFGISKEEIIGRHILSFGNEENHEIIRKQSEKLNRKEKSTYDIRIRRMDETRVDCMINMSPLLEQGKLVGSFAMVSDITQLKQAEAEVRELNADLEIRVKQRTEELNQTLVKVEEANLNIMASIRYAKMIQQSLLPNEKQVKKFLADSFFLWKPKDIIGGDIYHVEPVEDGLVVVVIDCTGHGVPGAFMTMIAASGLRRIIQDEACHDPAEILKRLNMIVKTSLKQDTRHSFSDDGLDATICTVNTRSKIMTYAGAKQQILYTKNSNFKKIKGDKQSIGYTNSDLDFTFTNHKIPIEKGMSVYLYTDGIVDQLGGEKRKRFSQKRFHRLLIKNIHKPFDYQHEMLVEAFQKHKGKHEQQDDLTVVGFSLDCV